MRLRSCPFKNDSLHKAAQGRRSFWTNDAPRLCWRQQALSGQHPVASLQFLYDMRLVKQTAIRDGRYSCDELYRRDADLLPHRDRANRERTPIVERPHQALAFSGQVDARWRAEPK